MNNLESLINIICKAFPEADSDYTFKYPNISKSRNADICRKMEISDQLVIYAHMGRGRNEYIAYTENGISIRTEVSLLFFATKVEKGSVNIRWEELRRVDYSLDGKKFYFDLGDHYWHFGRYHCLGTSASVSACENIADALTRIAQMYKSEEDILEDYGSQFYKAMDEHNYDEAVRIAELVIEKDSSNVNGYKYFGYVCKGNALLDKAYKLSENNSDEEGFLKLIQKGNECLDMAIANQSSLPDDILPCIYLRRGQFEPEPELSRIFCLAAMSSEECYQNALDNYTERTKDYLELVNDHLKTDSQWISECRKDGESDRSWSERLEHLKEDAEQHSFVKMIKSTKASNLIYVVKDVHHLRGCYDPSGVIRNIFTMDALPEELKFPIGHPLPNTLYRPHPMKDTLYIPYEGSEKELFLDKIREFCRVVQCLGAVRVSFKSIKGQAVTSDEVQSWAADLDADIFRNSANFNVDSDSSASKEVSSNDRVDLVQTFNPTKTPYVPDDVVWYNYEIGWQQLAKQRIEGSLLHYELTVSSEETSNIATSQKSRISAAYKNLIVSINGFYSTNFNQKISESEESKWKILVDFLSKEI